MTNNQTFLLFKALSDFPQAGVILIESEIIRYTFASDYSLPVIVRASSGSSAATHAAGKPITFLYELPTNRAIETSLALLSPAAISAANVDQNDIIVINTVMADTLSLTLPKPSNLAELRKIAVSHKTDGAGTLSVNSVSLAEGESAEFLFDGTAWVVIAEPAA